jgi:pyrimidine-specific ribonucleoside hydrolase
VVKRREKGDDQGMPMPLIIDCDPGIDDMVALLVACASPEVELLGVTTVAGNVDVDSGTRNALSVLAAAGRADVPVARGCARPLVRPVRLVDEPAHTGGGLGGAPFPAPAAGPVEAHAVELLARLIRGSAQPVTLVAVGPLTNIAVLYALHPDLVTRLDRVVIMGGSTGRGNMTPAAEFNIWCDPEAAHRVLSADVPTTMVGLNVTQRTVIDPEDRERVRAFGPTGELVAAALDGYQHGLPGGGVPVHDAVAVVEAIRPGLVVTEAASIEVDYGHGPSAGATLVTLGSGPSRAAIDIDSPAVVTVVLDRLAHLDS